MKHIFSIHSNICAIVIYSKVKELIEKGEIVVIVSDRNTEFPYFRNKIKFYDIQYITDKYRKKPKNALDKFINYAFTYLPHYKKSATYVIQEEDFILYISSCNYFTISPYLQSNHCKGYYIIEEGTIAYMDYDILKKRYRKQLRHGQFLLNVIGSRSKFDYHIDKRFKGCICINSLAFPWCKDNKYICDLSDYSNQIIEDYTYYDNIIVTDYLRDDINVIKEGFAKALNIISINNENNTIIGIKMHPTAVSYEKEKIEEIVKFLKRDYSYLKFDILPTSYVVENMLIKNKTTLFSLFGISSLVLYSLLMGSRAYMLEKKDGIKIKEIKSHKEILDIVHKSAKGI